MARWWPSADDASVDFRTERGFRPVDLTEQLRTLDACLRNLLEHPCDVLVHAAAYYGGIGINVSEPAKLYYSNLVMGANLMEAARLAKVV